MFSLLFALFLFSYAWLAYGLFCGLRALNGDQAQFLQEIKACNDKEEAILLVGLAAMALALTPTVIGLLLLPFYAASLVPQEGLDRAAVTALPILLGAVLIGLAHYSYHRKNPINSFHFKSVMKIVARSSAEKWLGVTVAIGAIAMVVQALSLPLMESDALEYRAVSRLLYTSLNLSSYPLTVADPYSGLYAPSAHPPVFHLALVWGMHMCGVDTTLPMRLITLLSALSTVGMVWALGVRISRHAGLLSALLLICTPLWFSMSVSFNIDPVRIGVFTAAFMGVVLAVERRTNTSIVLAGVLSALAMWTHAIGVLAPILGLFALGVPVLHSVRARLSSGSFPHERAFFSMALFGGIALIGGIGWFGASAYWGTNPFSDSWPAAQWPFLHFDADLKARRFLDTPASVLIHGVFRAFSEPALFGLTFWCALGFLLLRNNFSQGSQTKRKHLQTAMLFLIGFFILSLFGMGAGSLSLIKNPRYVMTLTPIAALLGGVVLAHALEGKRFMPILGACVLALSVSWSVASFLVRGQGLMDIDAVLAREEMRFRDKPRLPSGFLLSELEKLPEGRVLTFRQAEMSFYSARPWRDHFDPSLKELHTQPPDVAAQALSDRGIRYILTPPYTPVSLGQSRLSDMLADPHFSTPLHEHRGMRLWALSAVSTPYTCTPLAVEGKLTTNPLSFFAHLARLTGIPHVSQWGDVSKRTTKAIALSPSSPVLMQWSLTQTQALSMQWQASGASQHVSPSWLRATLTLEGDDLVNIDAEVEAIVMSEDGARRLIQRTIRLFDGIPFAPHDTSSQTLPHDVSTRTLHLQWKAEEGEILRRLIIQGAERGLGSGAGQLKVHGVEVCAVSRS
jgi:4-amino-4-deoxy-L-arabinose transferase-like glycosyltransferase